MCVILLRADNNGEGGTLALMALANRAAGRRSIVVLLGIISGALFYGDAMITPALSVLSAIEGLKLATPAFDPYVVPITVADSHHPICRAIARHRQSCSIFRTDHPRLVHHYRWRRRTSDSPKSHGAAGLQSDLWPELPADSSASSVS